jgi:hypothetical protein
MHAPGEKQLRNMATDNQPRVLLFSQRNIHATLFRCPIYEFEDIVCQIDSVELWAPQTKKRFDLRHKTAKRVAWHFPIALNPGIHGRTLKEHYDLFFAACVAPMDLLFIDTVSNWRDMCKMSICLLDEIWANEIFECRHFLRILAKFDAVMLYYSQSVKAVSEAIGRKCVYMPPGIDTLVFSPYPALPKRVIDVYSIGRRSEVTHQRLLRMVEEQRICYLYDSIAGHLPIDWREHRLLLANMAKRSRYFIVNPALVDRSDVRGNQVEIGNRYFEGAASGAIMIGEHPKTEEFERLFGWPDAVVPLPYGSGAIDTIIEELDSQPDRQEKMRRNNVIQALLRHDWAYRWEAVLNTAGLEAMPGLVERRARLDGLASHLASTDRVHGGAGDVGAIRQHHLRPRARGCTRDGPSLPG